MSGQPKDEVGALIERRSEMVNLIANLGILNERIGNLISTFEKQTVIYDKKFETYDNRLNSVEKFQMKIVGGLAVISILLQLGFNIVNMFNQQSGRNTINTQSSFTQPGVVVK